MFSIKIFTYLGGVIVAMPIMTESEKLNFLDEPGLLMRIGTVREDGSPLVTPIWFLCEEGSVFFTPRAQSEWFSCLKRDPRISLCIDENEQPYRKIVVEGQAELLYDLGEDDTWRDLYRRIATRYTPPEAAEAYVQNTIDQVRALYRVEMSQANVRTWRMPVQGESATGIWHRRYYAEGTKFGDMSE